MLKNKKGQALVEYVLIIALMSIIIITLIKYFGGYLKDAITKASCNVGGYEYVEGKKAGGGSCEAKSASDLFNTDDEDEPQEKDNKNIKEDN